MRPHITVSMRIDNLFFAGMVLAFILCDIITTVVGLQSGLAEANPLGFNMLTLAFRFSTFIILMIAMTKMRLRYDPILAIVFCCYVVFWIFVVTNNVEAIAHA